jgi:hypothetical protein
LNEFVDLNQVQKLTTNRQNDLAYMLVRVHMRLGLRQLCEREDFVDQRFDPSRLKEGQDVCGKRGK